MNDFSNLNHLPSDLKLLIVTGQSLVDEVNQTLSERKILFDLTSKRQLKEDCKKVEKFIKLISNGKVTDKNIKQLDTAVTCLRTDYNGLVAFFTR